MNPEQHAQFVRRAENRKKRSLAREKRQLRRAGITMDKPADTKPVEPKPVVPSGRLIPKSTGGCGSCRKKALRLQQQIKEAQQKAPKEIQKTVSSVPKNPTPSKPLQNVVPKRVGLSMPPRTK